MLPAEHVLEVKGINGVSHCEAIEFVTSHGRRIRFSCEAAYQNPGSTIAFHFISHPGRRIMGLSLRYTNDNLMEVQHGDHNNNGDDDEVITESGFLIDGCQYEDIPHLSPAEHEAAIYAATKEQARKRATLTYTTDDKQSQSKHNKGEDDGGDEYVSGRDQAAIERRVAEREAHISNQKYREVLAEHAAVRKREAERIAIQKEGQIAQVKRMNATMKSVSTRKKNSIIIVNNSEFRVRICWIDYGGKEIEYYSLNHDEMKKVRTALLFCSFIYLYHTIVCLSYYYV
mmetsp:Transcript_31539/g.40547  ORF Transcript_31539/g.40547 Transcript_31539/m.40547 type:complete len:286 (+) Transcript_31539:177-1034(+)